MLKDYSFVGRRLAHHSISKPCLILSEKLMKLNFEPTKISKEFRYTLGKETNHDKYFVSFMMSPALHRYVEYEDYYEISFEQFRACP